VNKMTTLENFPRKSISDLSTDEALELLRTIRLSRRVTKKSTKKKTTTQGKKSKELTQSEALKLLEILGEK
jgi:topoisomerase IA-like protein